MSDEAFRVTEEPAASDVAFLRDQINEFNFATTGYRDGRHLAIFLRDADGAIRAGLSGHTWGGCAEVRFLWVREGERHTGLGSALLRATEREAKARGCTQVFLITHSFQAPAFYAKHGYTVCGEAPDYPSGYAQLYLRKVLV